MNRRDDCAGPLFRNGLLRKRAYPRLRAIEQGFVAGKGTSKGAAAFMNNPG